MVDQVINNSSEKEVTEFVLELAEYEGHKITCIIHGIVDKQLDIELQYSNALQAEADNIRKLVSSIIVTALEDADAKRHSSTSLEILRDLAKQQSTEEQV